MNETRWPACGIACAQGDAVRRLLSLAVLVPTFVLAADIPLSRDPQTYLVLGMQRTTVNSLSLEPPGCNVGVNCAPLVGERGGCGFFHSRNGHFPEPSQVVANQVCGTGSFFQIFSNLPTCADPTCAAIEHAGSSPDCTEPFTPPILGDLDGDGVPSCDTEHHDVGAAGEHDHHVVEHHHAGLHDHDDARGALHADPGLLQEPSRHHATDPLERRRVQHLWPCDH